MNLPMGRTCVLLPIAHTISACDLPIGKLFCTKLGFLCTTVFVFVRSSHHKRKIIDICRKQTRIRACVSDLSALWKYAWRPKPAVPLIYTKFLRHCNECTTVLIRKRKHCVSFCVALKKRRVMSGKMDTYTKRKRPYNCFCTSTTIFASAEKSVFWTQLSTKGERSGPNVFD
jgi:hypothetical protein